jgi:tagatose-1,6-bisphosphate aldolase non-catalytic subunit AgaZ/GatZ
MDLYHNEIVDEWITREHPDLPQINGFYLEPMASWRWESVEIVLKSAGEVENNYALELLWEYLILTNQRALLQKILKIPECKLELPKYWKRLFLVAIALQRLEILKLFKVHVKKYFKTHPDVLNEARRIAKCLNSQKLQTMLSQLLNEDHQYVE